MMLRAVRMVDRVMVRALVRNQRMVGRRRPPSRFQRCVWQHPARTGGLFGAVTAASLVAICLIAGWRVTLREAPLLIGVGAGLGLLLALCLRWDRMTYEEVEHAEAAGPLPETSRGRLAAWFGFVWAGLTVLTYSEDTGWAVGALCCAVLTALLAAGNAMAVRRRRK
ncbi:hypothetical protein [Streptomyces sp. NPDC052225]|uniref:hypothetical protein n=1 Tax=Streptomyces sp. NPDC052225 TaxID=3154949 RepID=UPI00341A6167